MKADIVPALSLLLVACGGAPIEVAPPAPPPPSASSASSAASAPPSSGEEEIDLVALKEARFRWAAGRAFQPASRMELLAAPARAVWEAYNKLPDEGRTFQAFLDAMEETKGTCETHRQCRAEHGVRVQSLLQGFVPKAIARPEEDGTWISGLGEPKACEASIPALDQPLFRRYFVGVLCHEYVPSAATGNLLEREVKRHRFQSGASTAAPPAAR